MRVLVTGGAGYIGSHTCKALAEAGHLPIVYDNLRTGHEWAVKWGPLERGDINDSQTLADAIEKHRPEAVINFAALINVGESKCEPVKYYRTNVGGVINLLDVMMRYDIGTVVFSSTCATYGNPAALPITEGAPQNPINVYGRTKLMCEDVLRDACAAYGLGAVGLRYFNAAGADPDGELGEEHEPETHLIPLILQTALGSRSAISVFGTNYDTPDGTCIRDYVHVKDLAAAHVAALSASKTGRFTAYNLGTGGGSSVHQVLMQARAITEKSVSVRSEARRPGDPAVLVADSTLATEELNWSPRYSSLDNIIETAWKWMTEGRENSM